MAINDGIGNPVRDPFPGIQSRAGTTGAPGSSGASGRAADDTPAGPVSLPQLGTWQPSSRYDADTGGTVMPDQVSDSPISPGPEQDYASTGAGSGRAGHWPRHDWQQPDGGA